ncbi:MAG: Nif3-like dinuclear metal center hexameric protein [Ruminococcaceae bacterium]|nr:Nif3-like dinuclear metal center hexameric protein [Oscillospiraceae bacterium]
MVTVQDIIDLMESISPTVLKQDWDNIGLNCGKRSSGVKKVLVALDPFEHVCKEAADWGADLLLTHHPLIFRPLPMVTDDAAITRGLMILVQNGISHFCAHTNLDSAAGGVNDVLAETLGLASISPVAENHWNMLRCGEVPERSLTDFLETVKEKLHAPGLRYCDAGKPVRKVAVGGGACSGGLFDALCAGCDTFVTSDIKYNEFWDAYEQGLNIIDAGHFYTENPVVPILAAKISSAFPELEVKISESHADCMKYY